LFTGCKARRDPQKSRCKISGFFNLKILKLDRTATGLKY
jgi:hypothetical protein